MSDALVRLFGWPATVLHGDPSVFDRWLWLRRNLAPGPLDTLDAGCGTGAFTMYAARVGNRAVGLSFDRESIPVSRGRAAVLGLRDIEFVEGDLRRLDEVSELRGRQFDQIILTEVIEHIIDDRSVVAGLSRMLKPGGRMLITVPYKHYRPLFGDSISAVEDGGHVRWGYTHEELRDILAESGLEVAREDTISGYVSQRIMTLMRKGARIHYPATWAATFPLRLLRVVDRPVTRLLRYPYLSIGTVGVKPA